MPLTVFPPGTEVRIGKLDAIINQVCVQGKELTVTYQIVWWDDMTRKCEWVADFEVFRHTTIEPPPSLEMGFHLCR